eukprot:TRINITY_DN24398_c0_g1_i1.p1 TRINITY_DN24398_c0_g1~~TRINITY_DN24398_c0_g1_i1.p1  ORF type:complete len:872 (-),score=133.07 TRINITY_DN24398_c0_g1_i1:984-3599(-)
MSDCTEVLRSQVEKLQELQLAHFQQACCSHAVLCGHVSSIMEALHLMQVPSQTSHLGSGDGDFASWSDVPCAPKASGAAWQDACAWQDPSHNTAEMQQPPAQKTFSSFKLGSYSTPEVADPASLRFSRIVNDKKHNGADSLRLRDGYDHLFIVHEVASRKAYDALHEIEEGEQQTRARRISLVSTGSVAISCPCSSRCTRFARCVVNLRPLHPQGVRRLSWDVACLAMLSVDCVRIPMGLAWGADSLDLGSRFSAAYSVLSGLFWTMDFVLAFFTAVYVNGDLSYDCGAIFRRYSRSWLVPDFTALIMDVVVSVMESRGRAIETLSFFRLLRLMRLGKFRAIMVSLQNVCGATGRTTLILGITMFSILFTVLFTVHGLACFVFVLGRSMRDAGKANWLDRYDITSEGSSIASQYMWSFQWILTQFTPAPSAFQPQNSWEQLFVLLVIMVTIPVMGAQVGRATATINQLNEKSAEQNKMTRELQSYFSLCGTPLKLRMRMIRALQHMFRARQGILKSPAALGLMPSSLIEELQVANKLENIRRHPLFALLLMSSRKGFVLSLVSAFEPRSVAIEDLVFTEGTASNSLIVTCSGTYELTSGGNSSGVDGRPTRRFVHIGTFRQSNIFCEASLWIALNHSTTMHSLETGDLLCLNAADLCKALKSYPAEAVAVHEYAESFMQQIKPVLFDQPNDPDVLEVDISEDCSKATQLFELLHGLSHKVESSHLEDDEPAWNESANEMFTRHPCNKAPELQVPQCVALLRELNPEKGMYQQVQHEDERKRSLLSVLSLHWLQLDYYEKLVASQKPSKRLSEDSWQALQDFMEWADLSPDQCRAVAVYLVLRGLGKSRRFLRVDQVAEKILSWQPSMPLTI